MRVAVLAHAYRDALEDLLDSLHTYVPEAEVVVFNGGTDPQLTTGLDVPVCPYSRPLRIGNLVPFHWAVMRWLEETGTDYDFLVTVDWDVLFVRGGLAAHLERTMEASAFMGAGYLVAGPWFPEWDCARRINFGWGRWWRPLFGTDFPSWAFNPGLVFRREYVQKALRFEALPRIMARAARSRIYGIEEWIYATLAVSLGCNPIRNPGSSALQNRLLTVTEIRDALDDPAVHVLHKLGGGGAPERELLRQVRRGRSVDWVPAGGAAEPEPAAGGRAGIPGDGAGGTGTWMHAARERLKDAYFRVLP
jgi:hypothetical protein